MVWHRRKSLTWCAIAIFGIIRCPASALCQEEAPEIAAMEAAYESWLDEVEFSCHYTARLGRAVSPDAEVDWESEYAQGKRRSGVFNKGLGMVRWSIDNEKDIEFVSRTRDGSVVRNIDIDEVASRDGIRLNYTPHVTPEDPNGVAAFLPRDVPIRSNGFQLGKFDAGAATRRQLSPLSLDGNEVGSYLTAQSGTLVSRELLQSSSEQIQIRVNFVTGSNEKTKDVTFSLKYSCPVVTEIRSSTTGPGNTLYTSVATASDFVEVAGGPAARTIRKVSTYSSAGKPRDEDFPWLVAEWRSDDLGERPVTTADFQVPIKPETWVRGVANPQAVMTDGKLDMFKVRPEDLNTYVVDHEQSALTQAELVSGEMDSSDRLLMFGVLGAGGVACLWLMLRRTKRGI